MEHDSPGQAGALEKQYYAERFGGDLELTPENFDNLSDRITSLNERASHWLSGETSWLFENYVDGKVGILLEFTSRVKTKRVANQHHIGNFAEIRKKDAFHTGSLDGGRHEPVLIDVVRGYDAPKNVPKRVRSVCSFIGLDGLENNVLKIGILPAKLIELTGPAAFSVFVSGLGLIETGFQIHKVVGKRKNNVFVRKALVPRQFGDEVIKGGSEIPNTISDVERDFMWDRRLKQEIFELVRELNVLANGGLEVVLNNSLPSPANVMRVYTRPVELQSRLAEL